MRKALVALVVIALLSSCGKSLRNTGGEVTGARTVAFNLFDELHESRHQEQPYWDGDRWIYV